MAKKKSSNRLKRRMKLATRTPRSGSDEFFRSIKTGSPLHKVVQDMTMHINEQRDYIFNMISAIVPMAVRVNNWIVSGEIKGNEQEELLMLCEDIMREFKDEDVDCEEEAKKGQIVYVADGIKSPTTFEDLPQFDESNELATQYKR